jgi:hypothetical protein
LFCIVCLRSVSLVQCFMFLWVVQSWLTLRFSHIYAIISPESHLKLRKVKIKIESFYSNKSRNLCSENTILSLTSGQFYGSPYHTRINMWNWKSTIGQYIMTELKHLYKRKTLIENMAKQIINTIQYNRCKIKTKISKETQHTIRTHTTNCYQKHEDDSVHFEMIKSWSMSTTSRDILLEQRMPYV